MAMKDTLMAVLKDPKTFVRRSAQAKWRSLSARDPLERRVAKLQSLAHSAIQHLILGMATTKLRGMGGAPITNLTRALKQSWDPKTDFALAMLHAERLTKMLADSLICDILLKQVQTDSSRRYILENYLERSEPRCRALLDEISTTGERVLRTLTDRAPSSKAKSA
jgi:hypothetical protein